MIINFIRHGKTSGNTEKRYIGKTDESLCNEGKQEINSMSYPSAEAVICSPMKRCIETAKLIYPDKKPTIYDNLRECDFGKFEGKNYIELSEDTDYQRWINSNGTLPFPSGESHEAFTKRCNLAFEKAVLDFQKFSEISFIVHGGTIMSILEKYSLPKKHFFDFQIENGKGYITKFNGKNIRIIEEIK